MWFLQENSSMRTTEEPRIRKFAEILVERGAQVEKGDNVYLLATTLESLPLFEEVRRKVIRRGGRPHEHFLYDSQVGTSAMDYDWIKNAGEEQLGEMSSARMKEMGEMDGYIRIGGSRNSRELASVDPSKISRWNKTTEDLLNERLEKKWVATRFPADSMAQKAGMPTQEFEEMLFRAVNEIDYDELEKKNQKIKRKFDGANEVRITGENTDLKLSLENREGISSSGKNNIPDGEVFYAPVKDSLQGQIEFNYPGVTSGKEVKGIRLWFEDGRIVDFKAEENQEFLEKMIETDEGSHYIGEFGIGTNSHITEHVKDTLLDEKIGGTIHLALGRAYEDSVPEEEERNQSGIHWDIVKDLRPRGGGGKITVDGETVQEDGEWKDI